MHLTHTNHAQNENHARARGVLGSHRVTKGCTTALRLTYVLICVMISSSVIVYGIGFSFHMCFIQHGNRYCMNAGRQGRGSPFYSAPCSKTYLLCTLGRTVHTVSLRPLVQLSQRLKSKVNCLLLRYFNFLKVKQIPSSTTSH